MGDDTSVMYISVRGYYQMLSDIGIPGMPTVTATDVGLSVTRENGSAVVFLR